MNKDIKIVNVAFGVKTRWLRASLAQQGTGLRADLEWQSLNRNKQKSLFQGQPTPDVTSVLSAAFLAQPPAFFCQLLTQGHRNRVQTQGPLRFLTEPRFLDVVVGEERERQKKSPSCLCFRLRCPDSLLKFRPSLPACLC